ncbi:MAG: cytochrome c oxidase subunit II [Gemmatimonadetes bacterium]|nr:cytochrome c oxidase subunit II [Gemmatimonadota bacterium]
MRLTLTRPAPLRRRLLPAAVAWALAGALALVGCGGPYPQSTFAPVSEFGAKLDQLYLTIFWWAVGVFVVVEGLLVYVLIRFRARPSQAAPARGHGNTLLEIAWTMAPVLILIAIAVPTIRTIFEVDGTPPEGALRVQVVGHQWWWEYRYPDLDIVTANELHLPQGRPAVLELTSVDVIHSFWAPRLGGKRDVINGRTNRLALTPDSTGVFLGQCAEFCGASHANMRLRVVVEDSATFAAWAAREAQPATPADSLPAALKPGVDEFTEMRDPGINSCLICHTIGGISGGIMGPSLTHLAGRSTIAAGMLPNTAENLARWLRDPPAIKPGSKMPRIGLTEEEIAALVPYLQSLR